MAATADLVLVAGATGGVGQLTVSKLIGKGIKVRVLTRNVEKAQIMFADQVEIVPGNICDSTTLPAATQNVTHIVCCTGTTAFPSARWEFTKIHTDKSWRSSIEWARLYLNADYRQARAQNSPDKVDAQGVSNLVAMAPPDLKRFIFVSSCGILRKEKLPFNLLNAFGVLDAKQKGETAIINSGLPYTIIRPGRLIDGPYTSYDLNTLWQAKTSGKLGVCIGTGDTLSGQTSRIDLATACVECISSAETEGKVFELVNRGPRPAMIDWKMLYAQLQD
ncbi:MAG: SDR family oxidoreductase [Cyanothece sp. SIO1E1]|nr:SDR family oxidoreductase [Cyanothece sp. SIO1E1]